MGRRNDNQLTAHEEAEADAALRTLLARHKQPEALAPPGDLAARIMLHVPSGTPAMAAQAAKRQTRRRRVSAWGSVAAFAVLSLLGAWGVLINSAGPALLFGGPETTLGYAMLVVTLAAKPLIAAVLSLGAPVLLVGAALVVAASVLWWRLAVRPLVALEVELP